MFSDNFLKICFRKADPFSEPSSRTLQELDTDSGMVFLWTDGRKRVLYMSPAALRLPLRQASCAASYEAQNICHVLYFIMPNT